MYDSKIKLAIQGSTPTVERFSQALAKRNFDFVQIVEEEVVPELLFELGLSDQMYYSFGLMFFNLRLRFQVASIVVLPRADFVYHLSLLFVLQLRMNFAFWCSSLVMTALP
jgi:hypothetical protein